MASKLLLNFQVTVRNHLTTKYESAKSRVTNKFKLPEKYKGTVVEKWANYWKQLGTDYKDVALDTVKTIREKPIRSAAYASLLGSLYTMAKNNPGKDEFMEQLRNYNTELVLVHESCQNPIAAQHFRMIERSINEGVVRWLNLGVVTLVWLDNFAEDLSLYKATCNYLQPDWRTFSDRIIDIGWMNTWWTLRQKTVDYDVNL